MRVLKRSGTPEEVSFDKVLNRIRNLSDGLSVEYFELSQKVCSRIYDMVPTTELDELAAHLCSSMVIEHPDYGTLASRIIVSNHHKNTSPSFSETVNILYNNVDSDGERNPLISDLVYDLVMKNKEKLNSYIDYSRDYNYDYFGFKTLERSYLMKINGKVAERPQQMLMRVSLGIHGTDLKEAIYTYDMMSKKYFTHATPTLFNMGTRRAQGSSCFLLSMNGDSIDCIFESLKECAQISKYAGGIGIHVHQIRAKGSKIRGTNGTSSGLLPMLRVFNNTARYVDQAGRRAGSIAVYLEPWHADIEQFVEMKRNHGNEEERARDLFYALWIPDLFMERVKNDMAWSLMCPDRCKGLSDVYGDEFKALYEKYESEGKYTKQIRAQDLWFKILETQIETGVPYLLYKDACNLKSNQKNIGTIKSSNLCVAGDTMVLTQDGCFEIKDLKDKEVEVWNGEEFSKTVVKQTGMDQKLVNVTFTDGTVIRCTPYHDFYLNIQGLSTKLKAHELQPGMNTIKYDLPDQKDIVKTIKEVVDCGDFEDTYCFNEPKRHMGVFNGVITGQCTEIVEVSTPEDTAVCNIGSICLPTFISYKDRKPFYDFEKLHEVSMVMTKNLNKIIDVNFYPVEKARRSNMKHRPIGIGVQGLADTFIMMGYPFDSQEAKDLNRDIFETIYHGALEQSMLISKKRKELYEESLGLSKDDPRFKEISVHLGLDNEFEPFHTEHPGSYSTFEGSPASQGVLQFDMWGVKPGSRYDWGSLKLDVIKNGIRNSLLLAPMPTASTSQIMGFTESFEPITSNLYKRKTLAGEFIMVNRYLVGDLMTLGLWTKDIRNKILINEGSIQDIPEIPENIKSLYKTVWEISQRVIIDMAADRGAYVCQSQSMNLFLEDPDFKKLTSMHFYSWGKGLKTGCYYLRSKPKAKVQQFTVDPTVGKLANLKEKKPPKECVPNQDGVCLMCQ